MTDPERSVREAKAFCDEIRRYYGADPIIYCSTHFYETYLKKRRSAPTGTRCGSPTTGAVRG